MAAVIVMIAVILLSPHSLSLAERIKANIAEACTVYGLRRNFEGIEIDHLYDHLPSLLQQLFLENRPIIAMAASGIVIRCLAPVLHNKHQEPPVLVVAENGSAVVPLLGGHHGANFLANEIADILGIKASITTASDLLLGFGFDDWPMGWQTSQPEKLKEINSRLIRGEKLRLIQDIPLLPDNWQRQIFHDSGELSVRVTNYTNVEYTNAPAQELLVHPATMVLGIGCSANAASAELQGLVLKTLAQYNIAKQSLACIVSVDRKMAEKAFDDLAQELQIPVRFFTASRLLEETERLANPSAQVFQEIGCWGVAEGAALAAVGPAGRLVVPKQRSANATCAIAVAPDILNPSNIGKARGCLMMVGIGPGHLDGMTIAALTALEQAHDIVGYRGYIELLPNHIRRKTCHIYEIGQENERAKQAIDLALGGKKVVLIGSGDAGIYGMASLAFQLIETHINPLALLLDLRVYPGVTAMISAAAKVGAPLGHDFCAVSLSDLLTPWALIQERLEAVAKTDFVIALYNPVSKKRVWQFEQAKQLLLKYRSGNIPAVIAKSISRRDEKIEITTLGELAAANIDMNSLVIIGTSTTRRIKNGYRQEWIYTPRGYEDKK